MKTKVNVGCGATNFGSEWFHVDTRKFDHIDSSDIYLNKYDDNCFDLIYASHFLEYFDDVEVVKILDSWRRVLKVGGILRLAVPNFYEMSRLYLDGRTLHSFLGPLYGKLYLGGNSYIYHKMAYDVQSLSALLYECGFKNVCWWDWRRTEHADIDDCSQAYIPHMDKEKGVLISLNLECTK